MDGVGNFMPEFRGSELKTEGVDVVFRGKIVEKAEPGDIAEVFIASYDRLASEGMDFHGQQVFEGEGLEHMGFVDAAFHGVHAEGMEGVGIDKEEINSESILGITAMQGHGAGFNVAVSRVGESAFDVLSIRLTADEIEIEGVAGVAVVVDRKSSGKDQRIVHWSEMIQYGREGGGHGESVECGVGSSGVCNRYAAWVWNMGIRGDLASSSER